MKQIRSMLFHADFSGVALHGRSDVAQFFPGRSVAEMIVETEF